MKASNIPIGVKDFKDLVQGNYLFADKTMLIAEILNKGYVSILFTRPRRFGKTLTLSMIDRFFNIAYREEEIASDSFRGLNISNDPNYGSWKNNGIGNGFPVIRMDMSVAGFEESKPFGKTMIRYLKQMFLQQFDYLLQSEKLSDDLKESLRGTDDECDAALVFQNICFALTKHHGVRPIILVDEYDRPIDGGYGRSDSQTFIRDYGDFLRSALKGNQYVSKTILTGIQKIVVRGLFSSLNDMAHIGVTDFAFDDYFGITSDEMHRMIGNCISNRFPELSHDEKQGKIDDAYATASKWFDGYHIGRTDIFNPWSAMNFLLNNVLDDSPVKPYWRDSTECNALTSALSNVDPKALNSIKDAYISGTVLTTDDVETVSPLWRNGDSLSESNIVSMLLSAGYLTSEYSDGHYNLWIPNLEVRMGFDDLMTRVFCVNIPKVVNLLRHILDRDARMVEEDLETLMSGGSYLDGWSEYRYKSWLHDLFALHGYTSITERELGEGRCDLLIGGSGANPPLIFEFKVEEPGSDTDLNRSADEGIRQILDNRYSDNPEMRGAVALSVAFRKKSCAVRFLR